MNRIFVLIVGITICLFSCTESGNSVFTVQQEEVLSAANGTMQIYIDEAGEPFHFTGHLKLVEGSCVLKLYAPVSDTIFHMDTVFLLDESMLPEIVWVIDSIYVSDFEYISELVYEEQFDAPVDIKFDQYFERIMGSWEFSYIISPLDNVQPFGDFEFTFKYSN
jgi:hypothetical protein